MASATIFIDMPKRKKTNDTQKQSGRSRDLGTSIPFNVEFPPSLADALEEYKVKHGATKKWAVVKALEEFLQRAGIYPPSHQPPES